MRGSLWDSRARRELLDRLGRLKPDAQPLWGKMNAPQMLAHLLDWMRMAKGELPTVPKNVPLRHAPLKQLAIYWLPFPRGVPTAPELVSREPQEWMVEHAEVCRHLGSFETLDPATLCPDHPAFGYLTPKAWGVLGYRHTDHHLRQFRV